MKTDFSKVTGIGKETKKTLQENIQDLIHPWQYKDADIHIVNIDSDISDVETNWNQDIRFRQGFKINEDGSLNIPTMFVQINGIYSKKSDYKALLDRMTTKNTIRYKTTDDLFHVYIGRTPDEVRDLCKNNEVYAFSKLNSSMQKMMNKKLLDFVDKYEKEIDDFDLVLGNICSMKDMDIISMLQNFDYCFSNPKIIVENMDDRNFEDSAKYTLLFLYSVGFDIMIFSPKGSTFLKGIEINEITLEKYLSPTEESYDYRDEGEIKKAKKEKAKEDKKNYRERTKYERARKRNSFIFASLITAICLLVIGTLLWGGIQESSKQNDFEKIVADMDWEYVPTIMYVNSDEVVGYLYPSTDSTQNVTYDKDDEVEAIRISSDWVEVKKSSNSFVYIQKDDVREEMYDIETKNFSMYIKTATEINAYKYPDIESEVLHTYKAEDMIVATAYNSDWYQIDYNAKTGFVNREELTMYDRGTEENVEDIEIEENEETETVLDGEIVEETNDITGVLLLVAIVIFIILFLIFCAIMLF